MMMRARGAERQKKIVHQISSLLLHNFERVAAAPLRARGVVLTMALGDDGGLAAPGELLELARLERGLGVLATISNIAPLLGFLGTVSGMINSFDALARAGLSNPGLVAQGISEALITTATGLGVAIPILSSYNYFTTRVGKYVLEMETAANVLLETYAEMESPENPGA